MAKKGIKEALSASLRDETKSVKDRFDRADRVLGGKTQRNGKADASQNTSKVIRDSFTMPEEDYGLIEPLKLRCMRAGVGVNKSELLRAGLQALTQMPDGELTKFLSRLERVKPGRRPK